MLALCAGCEQHSTHPIAVSIVAAADGVSLPQPQQVEEIAIQTQRTARQTVVFALAVKLMVMILGILGYASMWAAVFADSGVALLCVANTILPLYLKKSRKK